MRIFIPTYRRTDRQITWDWLPDKWRRHVTFVCDKQDMNDLVRRGIDADFWVHPENINTIAKKRAWIIECTMHRRIIMLDDDLHFSARKYIDRAKGIIQLNKATPEEIDYAFMMLFAGLGKYAHVTIHPRQMNNQGNMAFKHVWDYNARAIYVLGYDTDVVRKHCELGRIEHREDMDYTLQLLTQGFPNISYLEVCVDQKYNARGGASEERSMDASNADAIKLAKYFPNFVKVVEKPYKDSVPRKEVIVQWKKAYEKRT